MFFQVGILAFNLGTLAGLLLAFLILGHSHRKRRARIAQESRGEPRTGVGSSESPTRQR